MYQRALVLRAVAVPHHAGPDPPGRTQLRDLLEELVVRVEEEAEAGRELLDVQPSVQARLDVLHAVAQRERELLGREPASRMWYPEIETLFHRGQCMLWNSMVSTTSFTRRRGRVDELVLAVELLEDVVLERAAQLVPPDAAPLAPSRGTSPR
jgi:hypothetical protein